MREFWSTIGGGRGTVEERTGHRTILDLGTGQIRALVLELNEDEGLVVGVGKARYEHEWGVDGTVAGLEAMSRSCDQALRQAEDMTADICDRQVVPDWVVVGLPNYLTTAQSFAATHHRPSPSKRINDKELTQVVERAQRLALQQLGRRLGHLQSSEEVKGELLESAITNIRVDGHKVTTPIGFRGETLAVAVFNVVVLSSHLRAIEAITEDLGLEMLMTVSGWQALASVLGEGEGICIDVGGKATDIVLVRDGKAWATATLPFGGSDFTKHLAETFGLSSRDADSLKLAYSRGTMEGPSEARVGEVIGRVIKAWLGEVEAALNRLSDSRSLPHHFSLCGGGSNLAGLVEAMRSHPWMRALGFSRHPQVRLMQPGEVSHVLDRTGQLRGQQDVSLLALAGYTMPGDVKANSLERLLWRVERPAIFGGTGSKA